MVNQKPAYIVIISSDQPCPIEGQVFMECGTACPPTCAEPGPVPCTRHCLSAFFYCYSLDSHFYPCNHVSVPILLLFLYLLLLLLLCSLFCCGLPHNHATSAFSHLCCSLLFVLCNLSLFLYSALLVHVHLPSLSLP